MSSYLERRSVLLPIVGTIPDVAMAWPLSGVSSISTPGAASSLSSK